MKRIIILLTMLAVVVSGWASVEIDGIAYNLHSEKTASVTSKFPKYTGEVIIPSSVTRDGIRYSVTSIEKEAFRYCSSLTSVTIPNSVTNIGSEAFYKCSSLTSVTIPNSVTSIGNLAFDDCSSLTSVNVGNNVTSIGSYAFDGCYSLTSVTINSQYLLEHERMSTIFGSNVKEYVIGNSVTSIGDNAFQDCSGLISVTLPDLVTSIGDNAFYECSKLTSINIPNYVMNIGVNAFYNCGSLTTINIPNLVKKIEDNTFRNCSSLISITIPNSVTSIGRNAFYGCSGLTTVTIPDNVRNIGDGAFLNCTSLRFVTIDSSFPIEYQEMSLIFEKSVKEYLIGNGITSIGDNVFRNCSGLTTVTIPNSVTSIGNGAFDGCSSLKSVNIPNGVTSIGNNAFRNCSSIPSVNIPNGVTSITEGSFYGCSSLESVNIPNGVTSIAEGAFYGCSSLESINIPNGVTSIGANAFRNCSSLPSITIHNSTTSIGQNAFSGCSALRTAEVNSQSTIGKDYSSNIGEIFGEGVTSFVIGNDVTSIGKNVFANYSNLTSITIGNKVSSIGDNAFLGCSSLETVTIDSPHLLEHQDMKSVFKENLKECVIGNSVTSVGDFAFGDCSSLKSVTIGNSVTSISETAFIRCSALTTVTINSQSIVGKDYSAARNIDRLFYSSVTNFVIGNGVTSIGKFAFANSSSLTSVTIGDNVTSIGYGAFYRCHSLASITIGDNVTSIGEAAFYECNSHDLESISIPNSVTSIGKGAFQKCYYLNSVIIGNSVKSIGSDAFATLAGYDLTVRVYASVPPSLGSNVFICGNTLYVPEKSFDKYKSSSWAPYFSQIIPMQETISVSNLSIEPTSASLKVGETLQLEAIITPSNATNKEVTWSSSNTSVAIVSSTGQVTAKAVGTAAITCKANDGSEKSATCEITVEKKEIKITSITLNSTAETLAVGATKQLTVTITPSNAANKTVTWSTSNASVATVSDRGLVTAKAVGTATITCEANDGSGKSATCKITVENNEVKVTSITLNSTAETLTVGATKQLTATISPSNATNKNVTWSSSNTGVATVSSNGLVTAKSVGTATITCMANDGSGKSATCKINVENNEIVASGTYYLKNTSATGIDVYLEAGFDWGTHAALGHGIEVDVLPLYDGKYMIDTHISDSEDMHFLGDNSFMDANTILDIKSIQDGRYTISTQDGRLLSANGTWVSFETNGKNTLWQFVSPEERKAEMLTATKENPQDATWLIKDPDFSRNETRFSYWKEVDEPTKGGNVENQNAEKWGGNSQTFTVQQTINVPNGWYKLSAQGFYRYNNTDDDNNDIAIKAHADGTEIINSFLFAGDVQVALPSIADDEASKVLTSLPSSMSESSVAFDKGLYYTHLYVEVKNGKLPLGMKKIAHPGCDWTMFDNFELTYYGMDKPGEPDAIEEVLVTSITLNSTAETLVEGATYQLSATVSPDNATNKEVTWSSSNASVATVSSDGLVTAKAAGTATITCKANDGSEKSATCKITVENKEIKVSSITLNSTAETLAEGATYQLSATISPSNATNKNVTWSSSNTSVATVSSNGLVTAKAAGTATITCKANDGSGKSAACTINVEEDPISRYDIIDVYFGRYATFYSSECAYELPAGYTALVVTACTNNKLTYKIIHDGSVDGIIPKGTAVILARNDGSENFGTFFYPIESKETYSGTNLLHGSDETTTTTASGENYYYKLTYGDGTWSDIFGWYWGAENGAAFRIDGHKAWLALPKSSVTRSAFIMDGAITIEDMLTEESDAVYYDLQGRRIDTLTASGVYIVNGKKVMIKK